MPKNGLRDSTLSRKAGLALGATVRALMDKLKDFSDSDHVLVLLHTYESKGGPARNIHVERKGAVVPGVRFGLVYCVLLDTIKATIGSSIGV